MSSFVRSRFPSALISIGAGLISAYAAQAEVPRVATDIAPVHALVARVMEGVGEPGLIVQPGASPHEYALRPSEAGRLQSADLVFWIGPELTPWLKPAIATLAPKAGVVGLLAAQGTLTHETREEVQFSLRAGAEADAHDHDHDHEHEHEHEHDHSTDHDKDDGHDHDADHGHGKEHGHDDGHGHDHAGADPHAWLSPRNALVWVDLIATELAAADPANAQTYRANAAAARAELAALVAEISAQLQPLQGRRFVVFHDAYQYFEVDFDFPAAGAIALSEAREPSPARIAEIRRIIADEGIDCVLSEPQFNAGLVATVMEGTAARTAVLDPLGADLAPGPALYPTMMRNLAAALRSCL